MPAPGVSTRIDGAAKADSALARAAGQAANPRGLYDNIGASLVTSTQRRFETGVAPDGSPWPPSLRVLAQGGQTLRLSGRLERSITHDADAGGLDVGTNVIYAAIHQLSGDIVIPAREQVIHFKRHKSGRVRFAKASPKATYAQKITIGEHAIHMPARPFLGIDGEDAREIELIATDWLLGPKGAADAR